MKRETFHRLLALLTILLIGVGCSSQGKTTEPPAIAYGEDVCDRCKMIIGDERFASAYWTVDGTARRFDDIGGMVANYHDSGDEVASFWVHDYLSGEWMTAEAATYVVDNTLQTPMGFGVAACAAEAEARALAYGQEGAQVLTWEQLLAQR
jgi:copper chaperone NosL